MTLVAEVKEWVDETEQSMRAALADEQPVKESILDQVRDLLEANYHHDKGSGRFTKGGSGGSKKGGEGKRTSATVGSVKDVMSKGAFGDAPHKIVSLPHGGVHVQHTGPAHKSAEAHAAFKAHLEKHGAHVRDRGAEGLHVAHFTAPDKKKIERGPSKKRQWRYEEKGLDNARIYTGDNPKNHGKGSVVHGLPMTRPEAAQHLRQLRKEGRKITEFGSDNRPVRTPKVAETEHVPATKQHVAKALDAAGVKKAQKIRVPVLEGNIRGAASRYVSSMSSGYTVEEHPSRVGVLIRTTEGSGTRREMAENRIRKALDTAGIKHADYNSGGLHLGIHASHMPGAAPKASSAPPKVEPRQFKTKAEAEKALKGESEKWFSSLNKSEKDAVQNWAGGDSNFFLINATLRHPRGGSTPEAFSVYAGSPSEAKQLHAHSSGLDSAIAKSPLQSDMVVHRALHDVEPSDVASQFKKGTVFSDKAFTATSASKDIIHDYSGSFQGAVTMEIHLPKGTHAAIIPRSAADAQAGYQAEILLHRGAQFKVVDSRLGRPGEAAEHHLVLEYVK